MMKTYRSALLALLLLACGNPTEPQAKKAEKPADVVARAELVTPPFEVRGEGEGLLLVWYDAQGDAHPAEKRSDIPEEHRAAVRVDALELAPSARRDPDAMFIADLRAPGADGRYPVRKVARDAFELALTQRGTASTPALAASKADVILYGASWCGACKQAKQYFTQKGVPFVEKDIEKEPAARSEMLAKAREQGVNASGIPVIDVKGRLIGGFNPARIEQLLTN
jgi:glutaredoxin